MDVCVCGGGVCGAGAGRGVHIALGVDHVRGGIRVTLTSLRDISSTSGWILAKVIQIHR